MYVRTVQLRVEGISVSLLLENFAEMKVTADTCTQPWRQTRSADHDSSRLVDT